MSFFATAFGTKVAITALALVAIGGGTAVAVTSGVLPSDPSSEVVTDTQTDSDSGDVEETPTATPEEPATESEKQGPDATGESAFGLCTAYTAGGLNSGSVAYDSLLAAAQTDGTIADYCAPVLAAHAKDARPTVEAPDPTSTDPTSTEQHSNGNGQSGDPHGKGSPDSRGH